MGKTNVKRQTEWQERQKHDNLEEYRRKELERVKNYEIKQNPNTFKCKHCEAVRRWHRNKQVVQENTSPMRNTMVVQLPLSCRSNP